MRRRIINHWTGGNFTPSISELQRYHFLIDHRARLHLGYKGREDNDNCYDGTYAEHTGGGNTKSIGIAVCGMHGFISGEKPGNKLITRPQIEKLFYINALILLQEGYKKAHIENLLTHYEFGRQHPYSASAGKIDITYIPAYPYLQKTEIGDFIRHKTQWYLNKLIKTSKPAI